MRKIESILEGTIFNTRWLLAPFYFGLVIAIAMLLVKFVQELIHIIPHVLSASESEIVLAVLTLVDISLVASLLLIIVFSGYENFVSKIDTADHVDRPEWMGKVDFSGLKVKLIASIVAISAIELLKSFVNIEIATADLRAETTWTVSDTKLAWKVGIHVVLVVSGVLFAVMDRIAESKHAGGKH